MVVSIRKGEHVRKKSAIRLWFSVAGIVLPALCNQASAQSTMPASRPASTLVLAGPFTPKSYRGTWYRLVYSEAFHRLGLKFKYVQLPLRRATMMASQGEVDGEAGRIGVYRHNANSLVKVPAVLWQARFVALVAKPDIQINSWRGLGKLNGVIDYRRGVWLVEQKLPEYVAQRNLNALTHSGQALERLRLGRSVAYVDVDDVVDRVLDKPAKGHQPRIYVAGTVAQRAIYPFLNKTHADLVPRLAKVLNGMRQDGEFQRDSKLAQGDWVNAPPDPNLSVGSQSPVPVD